MIKVDFKRFITDHCWFGWYYIGKLTGERDEVRWIRLRYNRWKPMTK